MYLKKQTDTFTGGNLISEKEIKRHVAALAVFKPCPQNKINTYIYKNIGLGLGQSWDRTQKTTGA